MTPEKHAPRMRAGVATGFRNRHAQQKKARMYRNSPLTGKPIRLVNLVEGKVAAWNDCGIGKWRERTWRRPGRLRGLPCPARVRPWTSARRFAPKWPPDQRRYA